VNCGAKYCEFMRTGPVVQKKIVIPDLEFSLLQELFFDDLVKKQVFKRF
jgi:hypothetical protein